MTAPMGATIAATITEHSVSYASDKTIHYLAAGPTTGPLILFIHGWPGSASTWAFQIHAFAALGFRVVAPDMPGYGKSTARRVPDDYCLETLVEGMMALLAATGRSSAVWVGHDWGAGVTSAVAAQHPEAVKALVNLCVAYRTLERGWAGFLPLINRDIYPTDEYEFGQWDYMKGYEEDLEKSVAWFDQDIPGIIKALMQPSAGPPASRFAATATRRSKGWFGGMPKPPGVETTGPPMLPADAFDEFVEGMQRNGFWPACAYYMNHERNAAYDAKAPNGGRLTQPVLFIHATWDLVCDTKTSRLPETMREVCENLTEATVEAGHWVQIEKPKEVNAALARFLVEELPGEWPGFWDGGYTKKKSVL